MKLEIIVCTTKEPVHEAGSPRSLVEWAEKHLDPHLFWYYDVLEDGEFVADLYRFIEGERRPKGGPLT